MSDLLFINKEKHAICDCSRGEIFYASKDNCRVCSAGGMCMFCLQIHEFAHLEEYIEKYGKL